jgi:hypothetical protein
MRGDETLNGRGAPADVVERILAGARGATRKICDARVDGPFHGAFSKAEVKEDAYLVAGQICDQPRGSIGAWIVLADEDKVSAPIEVPGFIVHRVIDADHDGVDELVIADSPGTHQGMTTEDVSLVELKGGRAKTFDMTPSPSLESGCGSGETVFSFTTVARVFIATKNGVHHFRSQRYRTSCLYNGHGAFVPAASK